MGGNITNAPALPPVPEGKKHFKGRVELKPGMTCYTMPSQTEVTIHVTPDCRLRGEVVFFNLDTWKYRVILDETAIVVEVEAHQLKQWSIVKFFRLEGKTGLNNTYGMVTTYDEANRCYEVYSIEKKQTFRVEPESVRLSNNITGTLVNYNIKPEHNGSSISINWYLMGYYSVTNVLGEDSYLVKPENIRVDRIPGHYLSLD